MTSLTPLFNRLNPLTAIKEKADSLGEKINEASANAVAKVTDKVQGAVDGAAAEVTDKVQGAVDGAAAEVTGKVQGAVDGAAAEVTGKVQGAVDGAAAEVTDKVQGAVDGAAAEVTGKVQGAVDGAAAEVTGKVQGADVGKQINEVSSLANNSANAVAEVAGKAQEAVDGAVAEVTGKAQEAVDGAVAEVAGKAQEAVDGAVAEVTGKAQEAVDEVAAEVAGKAQEAVDEVAAEATKALDDTVGEAKKEVEEALAQAQAEAEQALEDAKEEAEAAAREAFNKAVPGGENAIMAMNMALEYGPGILATVAEIALWLAKMIPQVILFMTAAYSMGIYIIILFIIGYIIYYLLQTGYPRPFWLSHYLNFETIDENITMTTAVALTDYVSSVKLKNYIKEKGPYNREIFTVPVDVLQACLNDIEPYVHFHQGGGSPHDTLVAYVQQHNVDVGNAKAVKDLFIKALDTQEPTLVGFLNGNAGNFYSDLQQQATAGLFNFIDYASYESGRPELDATLVKYGPYAEIIGLPMGKVFGNIRSKAVKKILAATPGQLQANIAAMDSRIYKLIQRLREVTDIMITAVDGTRSQYDEFVRTRYGQNIDGDHPRHHVYASLVAHEAFVDELGTHLSNVDRNTMDAIESTKYAAFERLLITKYDNGTGGGHVIILNDSDRKKYQNVYNEIMSLQRYKLFKPYIDRAIFLVLYWYYGERTNFVNNLQMLSGIDVSLNVLYLYHTYYDKTTEYREWRHLKGPDAWRVYGKYILMPAVETYILKNIVQDTYNALFNFPALYRDGRNKWNWIYAFLSNPNLYIGDGFVGGDPTKNPDLPPNPWGDADLYGEGDGEGDPVIETFVASPMEDRDTGTDRSLDSVRSNWRSKLGSRGRQRADAHFQESLKRYSNTGTVVAVAPEVADTVEEKQKEFAEAVKQDQEEEKEEKEEIEKEEKEKDDSLEPRNRVEGFLGAILSPIINPLKSIFKPLFIIGDVFTGIADLMSHIIDMVVGAVHIIMALVKSIGDPFGFIRILFGLVVYLAVMVLLLVLSIPTMIVPTGIHIIVIGLIIMKIPLCLFLIALNLIMFFLITVVGAVLAAIDSTNTNGRLLRGFYHFFVACENDPRMWYDQPGIHFNNKYENVFGLCSSPCGTGYRPAYGGLWCSAQPNFIPPYCTQAAIMNIAMENRTPGPLALSRSLPKDFGTMSKPEKKRIVAAMMSQKAEYYQQCNATMKPYDPIIKNICRHADFLGTGASNRDLHGLCNTTYCQNGRNEPFCYRYYSAPNASTSVSSQLTKHNILVQILIYTTLILIFTGVLYYGISTRVLLNGRHDVHYYGEASDAGAFGALKGMYSANSKVTVQG